MDHGIEDNDRGSRLRWSQLRPYGAAPFPSASCTMPRYIWSMASQPAMASG